MLHRRFVAEFSEAAAKPVLMSRTHGLPAVGRALSANRSIRDGNGEALRKNCTVKANPRESLRRFSR
jgi:hypothetical protein